MRRALLAWIACVAMATAQPVSALGPQVTASTLPNGATLLVSEQHNLPMVLVTII